MKKKENSMLEEYLLIRSILDGVICWYHKMKQLTCMFICAMLIKILKDKERVFSKQLFWITPFGVKAIRTAGSTADDGNFSCLID